MKISTTTALDYCKYVTDGTHDSPKAKDDGFKLITSKHLKRYEIDFNSANFISEEDYKKVIERSCVEQWDILFSMIGTIGNLYIETNSNIKYACKNMGIFQMGGDEMKSKWLYYYLQSPKAVEYIAAVSRGTTQGYVPLGALRKMPVDVVENNVRDKIVTFLWNLDEKIKTNIEVNNNLEQQAQALFKSWFLDYQPWSGSAPDSWNCGKLGDFTVIKRGGSPRPIQEYLSDSGLRWLKISDVTSLQTPFVIDIKDHIIEAGLKKTVFLKAGSLVLSNSATPGVPKILDVDSCIHDGWLYFPESKFSKEYLYLYFKYIRQQLINLSNGSVFNNLKTDILKAYPTILPDTETLRRFDDIVHPIFLQMKNLTRESHKLTNMRDALLPKLMSGKLDVSNINL